jgi:hypothetical protein
MLFKQLHLSMLVKHPNPGVTFQPERARFRK